MGMAAMMIPLVFGMLALGMMNKGSEPKAPAPAPVPAAPTPAPLPTMPADPTTDPGIDPAQAAADQQDTMRQIKRQSDSATGTPDNLLDTQTQAQVGYKSLLGA